ncbi:MAG: TfoX/Sxy family DNA transformation protein [Thalassospira sp.]|uniref:TfoX/Sxy family DNA transformation protein n=1 Tax=Thalassospira sp. TaxID=1912094 RepID=UPI003A89163C
MSAEKLRNIGPTSSRELREIGVETREDLADFGIEEVTRRLLFRFGSEKKISVNYLYALEGAMHDQDWRDISPALKEKLPLMLEQVRAELSSK